MKKIFSSLRVRLIIFVLLASIPALALTLYSGLEMRQQAALEARQETMRLVRFTTVNHQLLIENTRGFITALSHAIGSSDPALEKCSDIFSHIMQQHFPYYSAFYVADLNGNILCSMPDGDLPLDLLGCEHYLHLRASEDFVVSEYHICRNSGRGVISMGYPVRNPDDERIAVINIGIHLEWFNQLAAEADLPSGSTMTVFDRNGVILARYPDPDVWVGETVPDNPIIEQILNQQEGTLEGEGMDGTARLFAFLPLSGTEQSVFVAIGIPRELAYAEANQTMLRNLFLMLGAVLLALAAAWFLAEVFILRQTKSLVKTTEQLAQGDLQARTEIPYEYGELGQLAQSFDGMASSLAQRSAERDQAEQALSEYAAELEISNRELQDFANIASHDLQEPLRKIQTFSELLETRHSTRLDAEGLDYLVRMSSAARRMQALLHGLLAYSRITTRGQPFEPIVLADVVQRVVGDMDLQIEEAHAEVVVGDLPVIEADVIQMYQLFQNLLSNALKFQLDGSHPQVEINARCFRGAKPNGFKNIALCEITVRDNGIGFDEKYNDRIFQPFERLHGRDDYPGTGMGLAICRKIVERHNGTITATSSPDAGTTFIIQLPVKHTEREAQNGSENDQHPARGR